MLAFRDLKLTNAETLWLKAIYENGGIPDPNTFKVKFHDQLSAGFNFQALDRTFLWDNRLNIFGIWISNPEDKLIKNLDRVIKSIRTKIEENPKLASITAEEVSKLTGISVIDAELTLGHLGHHPGFWSSARGKGPEYGQELIEFSGSDHIDSYLNYKDIPTLLEQTWAKFRMDLYIRPDQETPQDKEKPPLCHTKLCNSIFIGEEIWSFHTNAAQVVRVLIEAHKNGFKEIHIDEIHASLPKEIESQSLSQIFKRADGNTAWKKLVIQGPSGKGFYQINPAYLQNGVREISLTS
jgi:hypothetical protein